MNKKNQPYWAMEQLPKNSVSAEEYNAFWQVIDASYKTDWEWTQLEAHCESLRAND
jgi:hypothetical protein